MGKIENPPSSQYAQACREEFSVYNMYMKISE